MAAAETWAWGSSGVMWAAAMQRGTRCSMSPEVVVAGSDGGSGDLGVVVLWVRLAFVGVRLDSVVLEDGTGKQR